MIIEQFLLSAEAGLGNGETAIFPISCFKVKEGINYNPTDPNYDLFKLAIRVSAKRLFPNFVFLDAPFNAQYYKPGHPETEAVAMGCRTRVMSSVFPESDGIVFGRGNCSFTSINLPHIGIKNGICLNERIEPDMKGFYKELDETIELVINQLLERYRIQSKKKVKNFPFLMGQKVWFGSNELNWEDTLEEVIKHGTLTVGFIGLAETLTSLIGKHHGESEEAQKLGLEIISHMRRRMDEAAKKYTLNFSLIATPAEGLCLAGDSIIQVYGGNKPIKDVKVGDLVYTYNETTNKIELKEVLKSWQTSPSREVVKVKFDNGDEIICTPDHPIAIRTVGRDLDGRYTGERIEYIHASKLKKGQRVKSNYIKYKHGHQRTSTGQYIHDIVAKYFHGDKPKGYVVHHKDRNKINNLQENLCYMSKKEHKKLHYNDNFGLYKFTKESTSGENNYFYGKKHTIETKAKISEKLRGKIPWNYLTPQQIEKIHELFYDGLSTELISETLNIKQKLVEAKLKRSGAINELNHKVVSVEYLIDKIPVYDLAVEDNHNFFVGNDGILVHNSGRFVRIDKKIYGEIAGVTDKDYYTNSFHIPVRFNISAINKITLEAPYHALTNAGHITYIELDGDPSKNLEAFEMIIRKMKDLNIGYGSINHPVDRDPVCGFSGVIGDKCPKCGRLEENVKFERIRRITGYLTGDLKNWNDAKRSEEKDRIKHGV